MKILNVLQVVISGNLILLRGGLVMVHTLKVKALSMIIDR